MDEELKLVFEAEEKAKAILADAQRDVNRIRAEASREAESLLRQMRKEAEGRAQELVSKKVAEAEKKGEELRSTQEEKISRMEGAAAARMEEAAELILKAIVKEK